MCRDGKYWRFDDLNFSMENLPGIGENKQLISPISS
jgi:hypothetical protein